MQTEDQKVEERKRKDGTTAAWWNNKFDHSKNDHLVVVGLPLLVFHPESCETGL